MYLRGREGKGLVVPPILLEKPKILGEKGLRQQWPFAESFLNGNLNVPFMIRSTTTTDQTKSIFVGGKMLALQ
jgi:hypothetical protein